jgi:catechol 2,3-dioxygenase-like lactoylglutathione lyase family enzyme
LLGFVGLVGLAVGVISLVRPIQVLRIRNRKHAAAVAGVSLVIVRVTDMVRAIRFYRDAVGLAVVAESPQFSFLDAGSIQLVLTVSTDAVIPDRSLTEIVFEVDHIDAAHSAMTARGVEFRVDPRPITSQDGRALHAADFRDPDGHVLSITGWVDAG